MRIVYACIAFKGIKAGNICIAIYNYSGVRRSCFYLHI